MARLYAQRRQAFGQLLTYLEPEPRDEEGDARRRGARHLGRLELGNVLGHASSVSYGIIIRA